MVNQKSGKKKRREQQQESQEAGLFWLFTLEWHTLIQFYLLPFSITLPSKYI